MATQSETKLAAFLRKNGLALGRFARAADLAESHCSEIRAGRVEPRRDTIERMRGAAAKLLGRNVHADELFDFGGEVKR